MLVIVGVNQSSINVLDPDSHSTPIRGIYTWENSIGPKQFIRSDEFLRSSPSIIGAMTTGINNSSTLLSEESDVVIVNPNLDSKSLEKTEEFRYFTKVKAIYRYLGSN
jgi:hypothetical protein